MHSSVGASRGERSSLDNIGLWLPLDEAGWKHRDTQTGQVEHVTCLVTQMTPSANGQWVRKEALSDVKKMQRYLTTNTQST